jgi:hypothetical protein
MKLAMVIMATYSQLTSDEWVGSVLALEHSLESQLGQCLLAFGLDLSEVTFVLKINWILFRHVKDGSKIIVKKNLC